MESHCPGSGGGVGKGGAGQCRLLCTTRSLRVAIDIFNQKIYLEKLRPVFSHCSVFLLNISNSSTLKYY